MMYLLSDILGDKVGMKLFKFGLGGYDGYLNGYLSGRFKVGGRVKCVWEV